MTKKVLQIREATIFDGIIVKRIFKTLFSIWFKLAGWHITSTRAEGAGVAIAAPHTSNWDFLYALGAAILQDTKIYFSIKDSWCRIPVMGPFMMWLGAMPIDRSSKGKGQVDMIKAFVKKQKDARVFFLFTPEGTRGQSDKWKTGFYHVAQGAGVPIFLAKVDYRIKEAGIFHSFQVTGDKVEDLAAIQASYETIYGKFPKLQYPYYTGVAPLISDADAKVMRAMYLLKGKATQMEIAAKEKRIELTDAMLDFLVEQGCLEKIASKDDQAPTYKLTFIGKGCLLHRFPTLAIQ